MKGKYDLQTLLRSTVQFANTSYDIIRATLRAEEMMSTTVPYQLSAAVKQRTVFIQGDSLATTVLLYRIKSRNSPILAPINGVPYSRQCSSAALPRQRS
jgi:hypothetical protein